MEKIIEVTLGEVAKECVVNMKTINDFLQVFNFYSPKWAARDSKTGYIGSTHSISAEMAEFMLKNKKLIQFFKKDYEALKSVHAIAKRTKLDSTIILHYLNNYSVYKNTQFNKQEGKGAEELVRLGVEVSNLSEDGTINLQTKLRNISSYKILKEIQVFQRRNLLLEEMKQEEAIF